MPVMDGLEASAKILELTKDVPIVALTANVMSNDIEVYKSHGIHDCVGKPFTSQELWRCLMRYFKPLNWQIVEERSVSAHADDELYRKLKATFLKDNRNKFGEITEALKNGDIKLAHRLAHTLKSNAAQLGKTLLQQASAVIEDNLKDGKNLTSSEQLASLETELNAVISHLAAEVDAQTDQVSKTSVNTEPVNIDFICDLFNKLEPLLEMSNLECRNYLESLKRIPEAEKLRQQIDDLDFQDALATLGELKKSLGVV